jgi:hypothetical protein
VRKFHFLAATIVLLGACSFQDGLSPLGETSDGSGDQSQGIETPFPSVEVDMEYGNRVEAVLETIRGDHWTFFGETGDVITISLHSEDFDGFAALFGPSGDFLVCDDDGGEGLNASIEGYPLTDSGVYTIVAMEWMPGLGGLYSLSITNGGVGLMAFPATPGSLSIGDVKSSSLAGWSAEAWVFSASAEDVVTIGARSTDFDAVLDVFGPDLHREAWDNDSLGDDNSLISEWVLQSSGRYTIVVRSLLGDTHGTYEIGTAMGMEIPGWVAFDSAIAANLQYGDTVAGDLTRPEGEQWVFNASEGDNITIEAASVDFDPFLALFSPEGEYLTCDDDGGVDLGVRIEGYTVPTSGNYTLTILSYLSDTLGAYTLTLNQAASGEAPPTIHSDVIEFGEPVDHTLETWVGDVWLFSGTAGDRVMISMTSDAFETALELYSPEHLLVARADGGNSSTDSLISQVTLPVTGEYSIVTRGFGPGQTGDYTITLTK